MPQDTKGRKAQSLGQAHYLNLLKCIDSPLNKGADGHFDLEPGSLPLHIMTLEELYELLPGMRSPSFLFDRTLTVK